MPDSADNNVQKHNGAGPLAGIRVLDLSRILAGPWASQLLADYGAEVIKVEKPGGGDDTRAWGPPWLGDGDSELPPDSAYFLAANRNKRSVTVNLASENGQKIVRDLARDSDVLLENFRVGTMRRYALDYASLKAIHSDLIYCSITAYGQTGSRADLPGYDAMIQASAGLMSITGTRDEPQKVGVAIADIMTGMYAATAILAALAARAVSGHGQYIDLALYDSQVGWLANQAMNYLVAGEVPERFGDAHPNIVPYQSFVVADGRIMLAVGNDRQFRACAECIGRPDLGTDARFVDNPSRVRHREELVVIMAQEFKQRDIEYWLSTLQERGVPAGPINDIGDVFDEPYANERQLCRKLRHETGCDVPTVANPVRFSETPVRYSLAPPTLGQHTAEVLSQELGYSRDQIESLAASGDI